MQTDNQCPETQQLFNKKQSVKLDKCLCEFFFFFIFFWKGALKGILSNLDKMQCLRTTKISYLRDSEHWEVGGLQMCYKASGF